MEIQFSKLHGIGNDYVYVDCTKQELDRPNEISKLISDRHFGIGSDGLILICASDAADFKMRIFNADGSEAMMCGNGIRCVGKFVYDKGLTDKTEIDIDTKSGVKHLSMTTENGKVSWVAVDMGKANFTAKEIPMAYEGDNFIGLPITVKGTDYPATAVSVGNPHAVIFCDDVKGIPLAEIGPLFEHHALFPESVNTEFIRVIDRQTLEMRVWERGSGETFACGTGACASVAAAVKNGHCDFGTEVTVKLLGGDLKITIGSDWSVLMKGPATHVFDGEIELSL